MCKGLVKLLVEIIPDEYKPWRRPIYTYFIYVAIYEKRIVIFYNLVVLCTSRGFVSISIPRHGDAHEI